MNGHMKFKKTPLKTTYSHNQPQTRKGLKNLNTFTTDVQLDCIV